MQLDNKIVILAASLGGPPLVNDILSGLRPSFDLPIIVLQQMESDFSEPLTQAWSKTSALRMVRLSEEEEEIRSGSAYVIPYAAFPVFSKHADEMKAHSSALQAGQDVNSQWAKAIEESVSEYEVILVLLSYVGLDVYQLHDSLDLLREGEGVIIRCVPSGENNDVHIFDDSDDAAWLDMDIDQIVEYLNRISRSKYISARSESGH
ncbi:MAG: hypothetical protein GF310_02535 [candidate division Zixibacteria bacterium]|nr:hypothetical protein [candidate division Zixibacteria bacterium]